MVNACDTSISKASESTHPVIKSVTVIEYVTDATGVAVVNAEFASTKSVLGDHSMLTGESLSMIASSATSCPTQMSVSDADACKLFKSLTTTSTSPPTVQPLVDVTVTE